MEPGFREKDEGMGRNSLSLVLEGEPPTPGNPMNPLSRTKKALRLLALSAALCLGACGVPTEEELLEQLPSEELMSQEAAVVGDLTIDMADYVLPACTRDTRAWKVGEEYFRTIPMGETDSYTRGKFVIVKSFDGTTSRSGARTPPSCASGWIAPGPTASPITASAARMTPPRRRSGATRSAP